jgi:hypothetical protein
MEQLLRDNEAIPVNVRMFVVKVDTLRDSKY